MAGKKKVTEKQQTEQLEVKESSKKQKSSRNALLRTIDSKVKVLNYWRGKYLMALNDVKIASEALRRIVEENEPIVNKDVNIQQHYSNNQSGQPLTKEAIEAARQKAEIVNKIVECIQCKIQKPAREMHLYPASMSYRCDDCKRKIEEELIRENQGGSKGEIQKPPLFRDSK